MAVTIRKINQYDLECDKCGIYDSFISGDIASNGIYVHSIPTAMQAAGFHRCRGKCVCSICYEAILAERGKKHEFC